MRKSIWLGNKGIDLLPAAWQTSVIIMAPWPLRQLNLNGVFSYFSSTDVGAIGCRDVDQPSLQHHPCPARRQGQPGPVVQGWIWKTSVQVSCILNSVLGKSVLPQVT